MYHKVETEHIRVSKRFKLLAMIEIPSEKEEEGEKFAFHCDLGFALV